jgi:hypothetical protein
MDAHTVNAILIAIIAASIVVVWVVICSLVRRQLSLRASLLVVFVLSILMSVVLWWLKLLVFILFFGVGPDSYGTPEEFIYRWTLGLTENLCEIVPALRNMGIEFCYHISPWPLTVLLFFILGLAPVLLVNRHRIEAV